MDSWSRVFGVESLEPSMLGHQGFEYDACVYTSLTHSRGLGSGFLSSWGVLVWLALLCWALCARLFGLGVLWVGVLVCLVSVWIYVLRHVLQRRYLCLGRVAKDLICTCPFLFRALWGRVFIQAYA
jgi:hypothetical protein